MNYVVDKVKGGVKRGCVHFDTPSRNELVLGKTKDTSLTRTDLSTATDQINMKQPKGWETIDKYIKQLKKG